MQESAKEALAAFLNKAFLAIPPIKKPISIADKRERTKWLVSVLFIYNRTRKNTNMF